MSKNIPDLSYLSQDPAMNGMPANLAAVAYQKKEKPTKPKLGYGGKSKY